MKPLLGPNFSMSQIDVFQHFLEEIAGEIAGDVETVFMKMTSALRHRLSVAGALALGWVWVWVVLSGLHLLEDVLGESAKHSLCHARAAHL